MITAKDIHKKKFEKVKFGYSPEEVDEFLSELENDMRIMQQNLDDSNEKVQLLADKVREYKETEEDLKNALLGAQKQAREVVSAAQARAAQIEEEAKASVEAVKSQAVLDQETQLQMLSDSLAEKKEALAETKRQIAEFKSSLFEMYKEHLEMISALPDGTDGDDAEFASDETAEYAEEAAESAEETAEAAAETAEQVEAEVVSAENTADPFEEVAMNTTFESRRDDTKKRFS